MFPGLLSPEPESIAVLLLVGIVIALFFGRLLLRVLRVLFADAQFVRLLGLVIVLLLSGAHVYHRLEGWSYLNSLYFTIITLTTVGYGDFSPETDLGKVFSSISQSPRHDRNNC